MMQQKNKQIWPLKGYVIQTNKQKLKGNLLGKG